MVFARRTVGSITSRCSGKEPALQTRHERAAEIEPRRTDSTNVFTSLLPPNSDHVMIQLGGYNCAICRTQLIARGYGCDMSKQNYCNLIS